MALPLRLAGASDEQISNHVSDLLGWLGLGDAIEKRPPELSMGQRQLVAIARAVIAGRPAAGRRADQQRRRRRGRRLMHLFSSLNGMGTAVVLATHSQDLLRRHRLPVLEMDAGRLVQLDAAALAAAD